MQGTGYKYVMSEERVVLEEHVRGEMKFRDKEVIPTLGLEPTNLN